MNTCTWGFLTPRGAQESCMSFVIGKPKVFNVHSFSHSTGKSRHGRKAGANQHDSSWFWKCRIVCWRIVNQPTIAHHKPSQIWLPRFCHILPKTPHQTPTGSRKPRCEKGQCQGWFGRPWPASRPHPPGSKQRSRQAATEHQQKTGRYPLVMSK